MATNGHPGPLARWSRPINSSYAYLQVMPDRLAREEDFARVCRICAVITKKLVNLFGGDGLRLALVDKINKYLPIKVEKYDGLPQSICSECHEAVMAWDELGKQALLADTIMRRRLQILSPVKIQKPSATAGTTSKDGNYRFDSTSLLSSVVSNVLTNYYCTLNLEEGNPNLKFICQKCNDFEIGDTAEELAKHLSVEHESEAQSLQSIENFIKDYVSFEESLTINDFEEDLDDTEEPQCEKEVVKPELCCPYCTSIFSSVSRLMCHLGKHMDINFDKGVTQTLSRTCAACAAPRSGCGKR